MKTSKRYRGGSFNVSTLSAAVTLLGDDPRVTNASVTTSDGKTREYDSLDLFLLAYASPAVTESHLGLHSKVASLSVISSPDYSMVFVEGVDDSRADDFISIFDSGVQSVEKPLPPEGIDLERCCVASSLHWETLPLLAARLEDHSIWTNAARINISRFPDDITYESWSAALQDIKKGGEPPSFWIRLQGYGRAGRFELTIRKAHYQNTGRPYLGVELRGIESTAVADDVLAYLGLQPDRPMAVPAALPRTAFIAHRFDAEAEQLADRLARFLTLLGFDVKTGRGFSPESTSDKVRKRIESQALLFVLLTPGEDATWLTQESVLAYAKDKRIFVLRDSRVNFKPGILGDLEYIPFDSPAMERTFIPILEGLRELGYLSFTSK